MAEYKDKLMADFKKSAPQIGEEVFIPSNLIHSWRKDGEKTDCVKIISINGDDFTVLWKEYGYSDVTLTVKKDVIKRGTRSIGYSPFPENDWSTHIRSVNYCLGNIIHLLYEEGRETFENWYINGLRVHETNFNPYVFDKDGNKLYYQRDYCWSLEQKQLLIESICHHINCGQILVRNHSTKWVEDMHNKGEEWACFRDIVDGKQRVNAIHEFMKDKYPMANGMYYSDFSKTAQWKFEDSQVLSFGEMDERTSDEQVIQSFLCNNFTGVPQSKEHIEYVKSIYQKL